MLPRIRKILVPLDFSRSSDHALSYATALAQDFGASLHLLHVVEDRLLTGPFPNEVYMGEMPRLRESLIREAEKLVRDAAATVKSAGVTLTGEVLIGGPSQTIVQSAEQPDIDLIVMGTHGRTGLTHLLIGSVAERVIRHAPCPVLVVRERKTATAAEVSAVSTSDPVPETNASRHTVSAP